MQPKYNMLVETIQLSTKYIIHVQDGKGWPLEEEERLHLVVQRLLTLLGTKGGCTPRSKTKETPKLGDLVELREISDSRNLHWGLGPTYKVYSI